VYGVQLNLESKTFSFSFFQNVGRADTANMNVPPLIIPHLHSHFITIPLYFTRCYVTFAVDTASLNSRAANQSKAVRVRIWKSATFNAVVEIGWRFVSMFAVLLRDVRDVVMWACRRNNRLIDTFRQYAPVDILNKSDQYLTSVENCRFTPVWSGRLHIQYFLNASFATLHS
jgi:hypothetical protein